jgi:hypothetical protein
LCGAGEVGRRVQPLGRRRAADGSGDPAAGTATAETNLPIPWLGDGNESRIHAV